MSWTDERLATLERMWLDGYSASQIATELGGVSRNAVIGKAHRIGLQSRPQRITPSMLQRVAELPISNRTKRLIQHDNTIFVGDLVGKTEAEILQVPGFGRASFQEVRAALATKGLRFGMDVPDWPPKNIEQLLRQIEAARRVAELRQTLGGATFEPVGDHFAMDTRGDEDDLAAAIKPMTRQMQSAILQKARSFADIAVRLDNQPGWTGIGRASDTLANLLDRQPEDIPDVLGFLYPNAIELGSFIELDQRLLADTNSYAAPLDPEVRRPLSDLVQNLAPWLRAFPSVREADDEANRFLVHAGELKPTFDVIRAAGHHALLTESDLEVFRQLHDAVNRGTFQGEKAGGRAKRSASNFIIGAVACAGTFFSGAVSSDYATTSPLVHKVGQFLVQTEMSIGELVAYLPHDLRYSILNFVRHLPSDPLLPSRPPTVVAPSESRSRDEELSVKDEEQP